MNATLANNIGVVLVTTTDIITAQYRNQKKCKKKLGVIKSCSTYAAYRGTFTQSETLKESVASYGIQAKKSISGNVVTLNNISEQQGGSDNQLIQSKLSTIESIESSAKNLQLLTSELSGSNESAVALTFDQETLDEALSTIVTLDDLNNFKTELISVKDEMQEILDQNKVSLASLETLVGTLKTLNNTADTAALESMIGLVKGSIATSQSHLTDFETLYTSFSAVADVTAKKNELLTIHSDLNTVLTQNVTALQNLDISPLTSNLETLNNTLRAEVGVFKNLCQHQVVPKIVS